MRLYVEATGGTIVASFECSGNRVSGGGKTLTEAVENLVISFKQLQQMALEELRAHGFITVGETEVVS